MLVKIWTFIDHNRFFVIAFIMSIILLVCQYSCVPQTQSILVSGRMIDDRQLALELKEWQVKNELMIAKFGSAAEDLVLQKQQLDKLSKFIIRIGSGDIPTIPDILKYLVAGGGIGAIVDNVRKRGLIAGLKRNGVEKKKVE